MRRAVSISLGASRFNRETEVELGGVKVHLERRGYDGDIGKAARALGELDGQVDALGLGGCNFFYRTLRRRYPVPAGLYLSGFAAMTPLTDGGGLKEHVEPRSIGVLKREIDLEGTPVLFTAYTDRPHLALAFAREGARVEVGDILFTLGLPLLVSPKTMEYLAVLGMPFLSRVPLRRLYPLGERQLDWGRVRRKAHRVIAGDFHLLRRRMPRSLGGTTILAPSLGQRDVEELRARGAERVFTLTPSLNGLSFGANAVEAGLIASGHLDPEKGNYWEAWNRCNLRVLERVLP